MIEQQKKGVRMNWVVVVLAGLVVVLVAGCELETSDDGDDTTTVINAQDGSTVNVGQGTGNTTGSNQNNSSGEGKSVTNKLTRVKGATHERGLGTGKRSER